VCGALLLGIAAFGEFTLCSLCAVRCFERLGTAPRVDDAAREEEVAV